MATRPTASRSQAQIDQRKRDLLTQSETIFNVRILDKFHPIASGAFGSVYEAQSLSKPESRYAVKIQLFGAVENEAEYLADEEIVLRLLKEERYKLKHERHLLYVYDYCDFPGYGRAICSDFAHCQTLAHLVSNARSMSFVEIEFYFGGLIDAIADLHRNKISHNDVKLANILLMKPDERIEDWLHKHYPDVQINGDNSPLLLTVLADFGLCRPYSGLTTFSVRGGTRVYMSFEMLTGESVGCEIPDIFAAGVCLYQLITGRLPFVHTSNMSRAALQRIMAKEPRFTNEERQRSAPYDELCLKMLKFDPSQRITTMAQLRKAMPCKKFTVSERIGRTMSKTFGYNPTAVYHGVKEKDLKR